MWQELVKNEVWYAENFLDEKLVDQTLEKIYNSETKELDANEQPHIISKSHYNYNHVKYNIREDKVVLAETIVKLNQLFDKIYKPILIQQIDSKNVLQFTTKTFSKKGIYNVHTERRDIYGDFVFIHYLTTEQGGELVLPDHKILENYFLQNPDEKSNWERFKDSLKLDNQRAYLAGPLTIKPIRNTCVVMRVGIAHFVKPVINATENCRAVITGWPFANMLWKDKYSFDAVQSKKEVNTQKDY